MQPAHHLQWLKEFVAAKRKACARDPAPIDLKLSHTQRVHANMARIAAAEHFSPALAHAAQLSAIYHDLARFDQYLEYGTFKDGQSRNHGLWAVQILKKYALLDKEPARKIIYTAIALHNRLNLPSGLDGRALLVANALRDADKLDILVVMAEHLGKPGPYNPTVVLSLPDDPGLYSTKTIADALAGRAAAYADLRSVNDFRLLLGTWLFSMAFPASRLLFAENGHARTLVEGLPDSGPYAEARKFILGHLARVSPAQ